MVVKAWSFDISPVAVPIAAAKLNPTTRFNSMIVFDELKQFIRTSYPTDEEYKDAKMIRFNGPLPDYYHPQTLDEILLARRFFQGKPSFKRWSCIGILLLIAYTSRESSLRLKPSFTPHHSIFT